MRIGAILVEQGVLTQSQVDAVLAEQRKGAEPFGTACHRLFGIDPNVIEGAWARQYERLVGAIDARLDRTEARAEALVNRRQAWQFRVAPLRFEEDQLVVATATDFLPRALRFASSHLTVPVFFVLVTPPKLAEHLSKRYPIVGMDLETLERGFAA